MGRQAVAFMFVAIAAVAAPVSLRAQSSPKVDPPLDTMQFAASLGVDFAASKRVTRGLYARDIVVGEGRTANRDTEITVRYVGALADGRAFTEPNEPPVTFRLGTGKVITGWDRGISGMRVGGIRQLVIAPALGYGKEQAGLIPPNSVLVFEVQLISVR